MVDKPIRLMITHLTSNDAGRLERGIFATKKLFDTCGTGFDIKYDIHVIVNSKKEGYAQKIKERVSHLVKNVEETVSDGTPGTGKNSVFEYFRKHEKDYDYLFQVDGDDFLYPSALRQFAKTLQLGDMPDAISFQSMDWLSTNFTDQMSYVPILTNKLWLYSWCHTEPNLREIPAFVYVTEKEFGTKGRIFTPGTSMILSNKFLTELPDVQHTNEISLFEDYLYYLKLFDHHLRGDIKMVHTNNSFFYVYDKANIESISTKNCFYSEKEINILTSYAKEHNMMEKHPKDHLPFITLGVPEDSFSLEDKVIFTKRLFDKFNNVRIKSLDLNEKKKNNQMMNNLVSPPMPVLNTNPNVFGPRVVGGI